MLLDSYLNTTQTVRIYLKLFFATGIPMGMFVMLIATSTSDFGAALILGLRMGVIFGVFMSLALGTLHSVLVARTASGYLYDSSGSDRLQHDTRDVFDSMDMTSAASRSVIQTNDIRIGVEFVRRIEAPISGAEAFRASLFAIDSMNASKVQPQGDQRGIIVARTAMSLKSFGESISIRVAEIDNDKSSIEISSKPIIGTTIVDYGKNRENVERITAFIRYAAAIRESP